MKIGRGVCWGYGYPPAITVHSATLTGRSCPRRGLRDREMYAILFAVPLVYNVSGGYASFRRVAGRRREDARERADNAKPNAEIGQIMNREYEMRTDIRQITEENGE